MKFIASTSSHIHETRTPRENVEEFRDYIESKLHSLAEFELQEYHYETGSFGNRILAYRKIGQNHNSCSTEVR